MTAIEAAVDALLAGSVVGLPTDTVYGLAAHPDHPDAVEHLFRLKGRPEDKPIAVLVASVEQAAELVVLDAFARDLALRHWPGALTLIATAARPLPEWIGDGGRTVGVRMPDHEEALAVLRRTGPLAVTSANRSGDDPATSDVEARSVFGDEVEVYVPGHCRGGMASTVVDVTGSSPRILRGGPVALD